MAEENAASKASEREKAKKIAAALGATSPEGDGNECMLEGRRVVIHCAAPGADGIAVSGMALDRVEELIGAFETAPSTFEVWSLAADLAQAALWPRSGPGAEESDGGMVGKASFLEKGLKLGLKKI